MDESTHWKLVAAYLASCHAATLEGLPKSAAKGERRRIASICRKAASFLRGQETPRKYGCQSDEQSIESDILRCERAAEKYDAPKPNAELTSGTGTAQPKHD